MCHISPARDDARRSNVVPTVAAAWQAGMAHVDVYLFPCFGKSASDQVNGLLSQLKSNNVRYGMVWFDIEQNPSTGCGWSSDLSSNCAYMQQLVGAAHSSGAAFGVYTSPVRKGGGWRWASDPRARQYEWSSVMGASCTAGSDLPLWYAHYDGEASFSDYSRIGGWTSPAIKQYSGTATLCGQEVDLDYYP